MGKLLIAYNDDSEVELHDFFSSCADEARQICCNYSVDYSMIYPPNLNEENVIGAMRSHSLCVIAAHGSPDGVFYEKDQYIVSLKTTNYNFRGKGFYGITCSCGENLSSNLQSLGLRFFIGYKDTFNIRGNDEPFVISALSGLKSFLSGDTLKDAYNTMLSVYDEQISHYETEDMWTAIELVHDKEALMFRGEESLRFKDL